MQSQSASQLAQSISSKTGIPVDLVVTAMKGFVYTQAVSYLQKQQLDVNVTDVIAKSALYSVFVIVNEKIIEQVFSMMMPAGSLAAEGAVGTLSRSVSGGAGMALLNGLISAKDAMSLESLFRQTLAFSAVEAASEYVLGA